MRMKGVLTHLFTHFQLYGSILSDLISGFMKIIKYFYLCDFLCLDTWGSPLKKI